MLRSPYLVLSLREKVGVSEDQQENCMYCVQGFLSIFLFFFFLGGVPSDTTIYDLYQRRDPVSYSVTF